MIASLLNRSAPYYGGWRFRFTLLFLSTVLLADAAVAQGMRFIAPSGVDIDNLCVHAGSPCRSIERGIAVSNPGDTLLVTAGTFYESALVLDKDLTIIGEGADETIVDGDGRSGTRAYFLADVREVWSQARKSSGIMAAKSGSSAAFLETFRSGVSERYQIIYGSASVSPHTFIFRVDKGVTARIQGLTMRDGGGFTSEDSRGGVINEGDLTLLNVRVENNIAYHESPDRPDDFGKGGGIWNGGSLSIQQSVVIGNVAAGAFLSGGQGGGIFSEGRLRMSGTIVAENETWDVQDFCRGGGLANVGMAEIETSEIVRNTSNCFEGGAGGGVFNAATLRIERSIVGGNEALSIWEYSAGSGGGIANYGSVVVLNTTISRNKSGSGGGVYSNGDAQIVSSTIAENHAADRTYAPGEGGGIRSAGSALTLWNTIVVGNRACAQTSSPVSDCALANGADTGFLLSGSGTGCIGASRTVTPDTAVLEVFGNDETRGESYSYVPLPAGPAIDSGQCMGPNDHFLTVDQLGNERPYDDPSVPNLADGCDLGAIERQESVDELSTGTGVAAGFGELPRESQLHQNFPNPFHVTTQIEFTIPQTTHATLVVFDLAGRELAHLVDGTLTSGTHQVAWNASGLPSGVYMYRLTAGSFNTVRQMILLKGATSR